MFAGDSGRPGGSQYDRHRRERQRAAPPHWRSPSTCSCRNAPGGSWTPSRHRVESIQPAGIGHEPPALRLVDIPGPGKFRLLSRTYRPSGSRPHRRALDPQRAPRANAFEREYRTEYPTVAAALAGYAECPVLQQLTIHNSALGLPDIIVRGASKCSPSAERETWRRR